MELQWRHSQQRAAAEEERQRPTVAPSLKPSAPPARETPGRSEGVLLAVVAVLVVMPRAPCLCDRRRETRALLSFKDELADEGPEFKVKKTNLSRRAAKMTERERRGKKEKRRGGNLSR